MRLVAAEPQVVDPVAMAFDEEGRIFVAEMRGYPESGPIGEITSGIIRLLEDRDGDGFYEQSSTFAEGLRLPTSVMPLGGGLLVAVAPDIIYLQDVDGDGRADRSRTLYTGFSVQNSEQLVSGLQWGLDNWVYANAGFYGGEVRSMEKADAPSVALRGRGVRFRPSEPGSLEPTSGGGQYGLAADDWGQWFVNSNSKHIRHIVLSDQYLRRNPLLGVAAVALDIADGKDGHDPACPVFRISPMDAWRVERARRSREVGAWWNWSGETGRANRSPTASLPPSEMAGGGYITSACSPVIYTADVFPEEYRGNSFVCEPANNLIHRDVLLPEGATFSARRAETDHDFLASTDAWFRPVYLHVGPDGALYVLDFYRASIENPGDIPADLRGGVELGSVGRGRIWRVAPRGATGGKRPSLRQAPTTQLVEHLADANRWWRLTAQRLLVERQDHSAVPRLIELARGTAGPLARIHALWTLEGLSALDDALVEQALHDPVAGVREQALRLAEPRLAGSQRLRAAAAALADDEASRVRFQLAFTLGETDGPDAVAALANIARRDAADPWVQTAVLSSAFRMAPGILAALTCDQAFLADADGPQLKLLTQLARLVGARADERELVRLASQLRSRGQAAMAIWRVALLEGLGQGMRDGGRHLGKLGRQPPAALGELLDAMAPLYQQAAETAQDERRPVDERTAAARLLADAPFTLARPALEALLEPRQPAVLQVAAVRALSVQEDAKVAEILLAAWNRSTPAVRQEALEALFARPDRLLALLVAIERKQIVATELDAARGEQLRKHRDERVRNKAQSLLAELNSDRSKVLDEYHVALTLPSDLARGKAAFKKNCAVCHRLQDVGTEVGPSLLAALRSKTPETLLTDMLDPSRQVDPRYLNYVVVTSDGRTLTGLIAADTASSMTLRRADKAEDTVLRSQIEEIASSGKSLMPEGLERELTKQDAADVIAYLLSFAGGQADAEPATAGETRDLFNGHDLTGWVNVNGAPDTWSIRDGTIVGTGKPRAFLRTEKMHENYVLELEWRHLHSKGNSGLFVHADALPQVGAPYPRAIEVQIHDGDHGSIFGIRGASIEPITGAGRKGATPLAAPLEPRCRPSPEWNYYVLTSRDGTLMLEVNGAVVTQAKNCSQQKGYIALQSEEGEVHFRNLRIRELAGSGPPADKIAQADEGLRSIFDGVSFAGWRYRDEYQDHWVADDGVIRTDGKLQVKRGEDRDLWTQKEYGDFVLVVDWRLPGKPQPKKLPVFTPDGLYAHDEQGKLLLHELLDAGDSGIYLRGSDRSQVNIWSQPMGSGDINDYHKDVKLPVEIRRACLPKKKADAPFGQWNRFRITMRGPRVTVVLNGETVIEEAELPGVPARGRLALQDHHDPVEFRNLFLKEIE
ncbi:MAG TPA: PVC-type heme-binding CxxCH protein [Pirellulales bacterium]|nr:PVC-type heme-binding CxxCH protein [Pirellulales bacterium]